MNLFSRLWRRLKLVYLFLLPIRFSLLALAVAAFAFIISDQGQDIVRALGEYDPDPAIRAPHWGRILGFLGLMNVLAYQIWFWSRQMLRLESPHAEEDDAWFGHAPDPQDDDHRGWALWLPRILGSLLFVVMFYAFFKVRCTYGDVKTANTSILLLVALSFVLFLLFVVLRRKWLDKHGDDGSIRPVRLRDLAKSALVMLVAFLVFELIFFIASSISPASLMGFGAGNMVLLTLALWVPFGSVIVYAGIRMRIPILTFLIVLAFLVSPIADRNHIVRTVPTAKTIIDARPTVEQKLMEWHGRVANPAAPTPVFIVATEGGGIRAAYWTAVVLDSLHDTMPQFHKNLFGISSVSGGSLGALVFTGLLSENGGGLHDRGSAILGNDFLTPTLAAMTQSDFVQRFLPFGFPDRERALETAWERPSAILTKGLLDTYAQHAELPSLFVNGTMVETGDRIITSNCRIRPALEFRNAFDGFDLLRSDIPLSSAAGMSARFTYVSPAGRIPMKDHVGHVVDGGYFENSGAVTAAELVVLINRVSKANGWNLVPVVILIDYQNCSVKGRDCSEDEPNQLGKSLCPDEYGPFPYHGPEGPSTEFNAERWANEVLSPLRALLNTRGARGEQAVGDVRNAQLPVGALPTLLEFRLVQVDVPIPLGWVLSYQSRNAMDGAMETQGNRWSRDQIARWLNVQVAPDPAAMKANEDLQKVREVKQ